MQICKGKKKKEKPTEKKKNPNHFSCNESGPYTVSQDHTLLLLNTIHYHGWMEVANPGCPFRKLSLDGDDST